MYQLIGFRNEAGVARLHILLDDTKVDKYGNPDRNFVVTVKIPAPARGGDFDTWMQSSLQSLEGELAAQATLRGKARFDEFGKWKDYKWSGSVTIP